MAVKRRDFLKLAERIGAGDVYTECGTDLNQVFGRAMNGQIHVIWLQGTSDPGCTISLLQSIHPDLAETIIDFRLAVEIGPTLTTPPSDRALLSLSNALAGRTPLDLLIIEGGVSSGGLCSIGGIGGRLVPFETWVRDLAAVAKQVVALGTCAAAGNISSTRPHSKGCRPVSHFIGATPLLEIPGCPAPPDQVILTLATVLSSLAPSFRDHRGPRSLFHEVLRPLSRLGDQLTGCSSKGILSGPGIPDIVRPR